VASADGAWSHRGWRARQHTYLVRDFGGNTVVCCVVLRKDHIVSILDPKSGNWVEKNRAEGNYIGTSKGMEGEAFSLAMDQIQDSGLDTVLDRIVVDGDSGVRNLLSNNAAFEDVSVAGDPGHRKKNFAKALAKIFPATGEKALYPWRISMFFIRCLKRAEKEFEGFTEEAMLARQERFEELWQHAYAHYTRPVCPPECPCQENVDSDGGVALADAPSDVSSDVQGLEVNALMGLLDLQDDGGNEAEIDLDADVASTQRLVMEERRVGAVPVPCGPEDGRNGKKDWLDESNAKDAAICKQLKPLLEQAANGVGEILWGLNTCMSEASNSRRLKFCRKDRFFYATYEARSTVAAMLENISPVDVLDRVYAHFGFVCDEDDEEIRERLAQLQKRRDWDSERKQSVEFKRRSGTLNRMRAVGRRRELVDDKRVVLPAKRAYNVDGEKVLGNEHPQGKRSKSVGGGKAGEKQSNPFQTGRAGKTTQEELQRRLDGGERIMKCGHCGVLYLKTHKTCSKTKMPLKVSLSKSVSDYSEAQLEDMLERGQVKQCPLQGCGMYYFSRHRGCLAKKRAKSAPASHRPQKKKRSKSSTAGSAGHVEQGQLLAQTRSRHGQARQTWSHLLGGSESGDEDNDVSSDQSFDYGDALDPAVVAREMALVNQESLIYDYAQQHQLQVNPEVEDNGNCFFSALMFQLHRVDRRHADLTAAQVRANVVAHAPDLNLEASALVHLFQDLQEFDNVAVETLEEWQAHMARDRAWADQLCLDTAAHHFDICIKVVRGYQGQLEETQYGDASKPLVLLGYTLNRHYYSLE
jgi:hypothetical protein